MKNLLEPQNDQANPFFTTIVFVIVDVCRRGGKGGGGEGASVEKQKYANKI